MGLKYNCLVTLFSTEFSSETGTEKRVIKFTFFWANSRTISRPIRFTKSKTKKINGTAWLFFTRCAKFRPNFHFRASLLHPSCNFRFFSVIHYVRTCPGIWMHKETNFIKYRVCCWLCQLLTMRPDTCRRLPRNTRNISNSLWILLWSRHSSLWVVYWGIFTHRLARSVNLYHIYLFANLPRKLTRSARRFACDEVSIRWADNNRHSSIHNLTYQSALFPESGIF